MFGRTLTVDGVSYAVKKSKIIGGGQMVKTVLGGRVVAATVDHSRAAEELTSLIRQVNDNPLSSTARQ